MKTHWMTGLALIATAGLTRATIVAEYLFDQNLNNTHGSGYAMSEVAGSGSYAQSSVWGETKYTLNLTGAQGLTVDVSAVVDRNIYTVIMDVQSSEVQSYNKLFSWNSGLDDGIYIYNADPLIYAGNGFGFESDSFPADTWVRVALVSTGTEQRLYVGSKGSVAELTGSLTDSPDLADSVLFFKDDDVSLTRENYDLSVSSVWISDSPMSLSQIAAIPEPTAVSLLVLAAGLLITRRRRS